MAYTTGETALTKQVIAYLDDLHEKRGLPIYYEHRSGSGGLSYKKGSPDLFVVVGGVHIECELKTPKGKRSTSQDKWKYRCESEWQIPYCNPHTFQEFVDFLQPFIDAL